MNKVNFFLKPVIANFFTIAVVLILSCNTKIKEEPHPPLWEDIQVFKKQDAVSFPQKNAILFIGSSSFTLWTDVQDYFPGYTIINRGFGSSTLADQIHYAKDIIFPYKPKQVVIYCGENDLAFSDTVNAAMVFDRFKTLFGMIREKFSDLPLIYISMKPSPSRRHLIPMMQEGNQLIKNFLVSQTNTVYLDVHQLMLNANAEPMSDIFLDDSLHINAKGYTIWQQAITPHLLKD